MADLFKEYDSSSSESGDEANKKPNDDMLFESNNLIPLSKHKIWINITSYRATIWDIARRFNEKHEWFLRES